MRKKTKPKGNVLRRFIEQIGDDGPIKDPEVEEFRKGFAASVKAHPIMGPELQRLLGDARDTPDASEPTPQELPVEIDSEAGILQRTLNAIAAGEEIPLTDPQLEESRERIKTFFAESLSDPQVLSPESENLRVRLLECLESTEQGREWLADARRVVHKPSG